MLMMCWRETERSVFSQPLYNEYYTATPVKNKPSALTIAIGLGDKNLLKAVAQVFAGFHCSDKLFNICCHNIISVKYKRT